MNHVYGMWGRCKKVHLFPTSKKVNYIHKVLTISSLSQSKKTYGNSIPKNVHAMMMLVSVFIQLKHYGSVLMSSVLPLLGQQERFPLFR
jgi:hypothetical protein